MVRNLSYSMKSKNLIIMSRNLEADISNSNSGTSGTNNLPTKSGQ